MENEEGTYYSQLDRTKTEMEGVVIDLDMFVNEVSV